MAKISWSEQGAITDQIKLQLHMQGDEFLGLLEKIANHPLSDDIHELRVAARKIRTILWLLKRDQRFSSIRNLSRRLKELGRELGKLRELDVTQRILLDFHSDANGLSSKRKRRATHVKNYLSPPNKKRLETDLRRVIKEVDHVSHLHTEESFAKLVKVADYWSPGPGIGKQELHKFRIDIKRIRYALEAVHSPDKKLRRLQGLLGLIHDLDVIPKGRRNAAISAERKRVQRVVAKKTPAIIREAAERLRYFSGSFA